MSLERDGVLQFINNTYTYNYHCCGYDNVDDGDAQDEGVLHICLSLSGLLGYCHQSSRWQLNRYNLQNSQIAQPGLLRL